VYLALTQAVDVGLLYRVYLLLGFLTYIPGELRNQDCFFSKCYRADFEYSKLHHVYAYVGAKETYIEAGGA
jgi:hypothetical protein